MNIMLENNHLKVQINTTGAELNSIVNKQTELEYMWSGDPEFWAKTSPVLFPIVGALKKDKYLYNGKAYSLSRHGFARDAIFEIIEKKDDLAIFSFSSSTTSLEKYPFKFVLRLEYKIVEEYLEVSYHVKNNGDSKMYFSVGGHPAFTVPLTSDSTYEDYYLEFNAVENAGRWPISSEGLIKEQPVPFLRNTSILKLNRTLFNEDALVFKNLKSDKISLKSQAHDHGLDFYFEGFPYLGIWAAKNADFVCIEPWCGIADSVFHDQQLTTKQGIVQIQPDELWTRTWKVRFY